MRFIGHVVQGMFTAWIALGLVFALYALLLLPVTLYTRHVCLRDGYSASQVTILLDRYCERNGVWVRQ